MGYPESSRFECKSCPSRHVSQAHLERVLQTICAFQAEAQSLHEAISDIGFRLSSLNERFKGLEEYVAEEFGFLWQDMVPITDVLN